MNNSLLKIITYGGLSFFMASLGSGALTMISFTEREREAWVDTGQTGKTGMVNQREMSACVCMCLYLTSPTAIGFSFTLSVSGGFTGLCLPTVQP